MPLSDLSLLSFLFFLSLCSVCLGGYEVARAFIFYLLLSSLFIPAQVANAS